MARKVKDKGDGELGKDGTKLLTNAGARRDRLQGYFQSRYAIESEILDLIAEHISPLREDKNRLNREVRAELDMTGADIAPLYAVYKRGRDVEAFDDTGLRDKALDTMREVFEAMQQGGQIDFIGVLDDAPPKPADPAFTEAAAVGNA